MKSLLNIVKKIVFYSVVAFIMLHLVFSGLFPEKMMPILGYRNFVVLTPSMEPVIDAGDMIFIKSVNEEDLSEGDIITFSVYIDAFDQVSYVTHYIASIDTNDDGETIYKTQGYGKAIDDYDDWEDAFGNPIDITYEDIEGIYLFHIPKIGYVSAFLSNPVYLVVFIINITVIYYTVQYIKKQKKSEDQ